MVSQIIMFYSIALDGSINMTNRLKKGISLNLSVDFSHFYKGIARNEQSNLICIHRSLMKCTELHLCQKLIYKVERDLPN